MIPRSKWKYRGVPGHFCAADNCVFRLCTDIGRYRISTVGAYYLKQEPGARMTELGEERHYETMVFRIFGSNVDWRNALEMEPLRFQQGEKEDYYAAAERHDAMAETMHDAMCVKWAKRQPQD